jgi:hypothetical protein
MKKITYFLTIMFALTLMSVSCCKDDGDIVPDNTITIADLNGTWNFQKFEYAGILTILPTTSCADVSVQTAQLNSNKPARWVKLSLNIDANGCDLNDACDANSPQDNAISFDNVTNKITLDNGIVFKILLYDKTNKLLKLSLLEPISGTDYILENATYTLKK